MVKTKEKEMVVKIIEWQNIPVNKTPTEVLKEWHNLGKINKKRVNVA